MRCVQRRDGRSRSRRCSSAWSVGCGATSPRSEWRLPNGDLAGTRAASERCRRLRQRPEPPGALAVRVRGAPELLGHLRLDPRRRSHHRLRPGPAKQRVRDRPLHRSAPVGEALPRAERRPERAGGGRRACLRRDRHGCVRALDRDRPGAVAPAPDERERAVRRRRSRSLAGHRLHRAPSATRPAGAGRSTRWTPPPAPCAGSSTRSSVRGGIRARRAAAASGTRSRWMPGAGSMRATRTPRPGAARRCGRTEARSPARPGTPTRCSCSTRERAACSGTTRSPRTTSATTTSRRRRSSRRWGAPRSSSEPARRGG